MIGCGPWTCTTTRRLTVAHATLTLCRKNWEQGFVKRSGTARQQAWAVRPETREASESIAPREPAYEAGGGRSTSCYGGNGWDRTNTFSFFSERCRLTTLRSLGKNWHGRQVTLLHRVVLETTALLVGHVRKAPERSDEKGNRGSGHSASEDFSDVRPQ